MFVGETGLDEGASAYADWRQPTFRIPPTLSLLARCPLQ